MVLNKRSKLSLLVIAAGLTIALSTFVSTTPAFAADTTASTSGLTKPLLAIAAAIAIAGGLIGTGNAQQGIGAAGMGIIAEKPEKFGQKLPRTARCSAMTNGKPPILSQGFPR